MEVDLKLAEAFALIMRSGSLTKAENQTGMPKATLSRMLRKLEEDLGVQLLQRTSRRLAPTDAGIAFHTHCEALLADVSGRWKVARDDVHEIAAGGKGRLRILSDNHFTTTFVCHITRLFLEKYPNITCELDAAGREDSPRIEDVDCYICGQPPDLPDLVAKCVGQLTYALYASPAYLRRNPASAGPQELAAHTSITLRRPEFAGRTVAHSEHTPHPFVSRFSILTNDYWVMKTFCVDGLGIALLPDFFANPEVRAGSLVKIFPDWRPEIRSIYCAYLRQRFAAKKLQSFIELLTESMSNLDSLNTYVSSAIARPRSAVGTSAAG